MVRTLYWDTKGFIVLKFLGGIIVTLIVALFISIVVHTRTPEVMAETAHRITRPKQSELSPEEEQKFLEFAQGIQQTLRESDAFVKKSKAAVAERDARIEADLKAADEDYERKRNTPLTPQELDREITRILTMPLPKPGQ